MKLGNGNVMPVDWVVLSRGHPDRAEGVVPFNLYSLSTLSYRRTLQAKYLGRGRQQLCRLGLCYLREIYDDTADLECGFKGPLETADPQRDIGSC